MRKLSARSARNCFREYGQKIVFTKCATALRAFDEPQLQIQDYEEAARISNICRVRGIAGSAIDTLICAISQLRSPGEIRYLLRVVLDGNPRSSDATELPLPEIAPLGSLVKFELKENCPLAVGL